MKIGLEIHIRPNSKCKLFSDSLNLDSTRRDKNTNVSLFDIAVPGVMPKLNHNLVLQGMRLAIILKCRINRTFYFDRKHYGYPDLPLGYQITQFHKPLAVKGIWNGRIRIKQIHLEIDAAKTLRDNGNWEIDYNRSGIPLLEVVTEPDFRSYEDLKEFLTELQVSCRGHGISCCDLSKGDLRFDLNISDKYLSRQEIKNLNSFNSAKECIRQIIHYREKDSFTWDWDEQREILKKSRMKEIYQEYFYLQEPDLPIFRIPRRLLIGIRKDIITVNGRLSILREVINDQHLYRKVVDHKDLYLIRTKNYSNVQLHNLGKALAWSNSLTDKQIGEIIAQKVIVKDRILGDFVKGKLMSLNVREDIIPDEIQWKNLIDSNTDLWEGILNGNEKLIGPLISQARRMNYSVKWVKNKIDDILKNEQ